MDSNRFKITFENDDVDIVSFMTGTCVDLSDPMIPVVYSLAIDREFKFMDSSFDVSFQDSLKDGVGFDFEVNAITYCKYFTVDDVAYSTPKDLIELQLGIVAKFEKRGKTLEYAWYDAGSSTAKLVVLKQDGSRSEFAFSASDRESLIDRLLLSSSVIIERIDQHGF